MFSLTTLTGGVGCEGTHWGPWVGFRRGTPNSEGGGSRQGVTYMGVYLCIFYSVMFAHIIAISSQFFFFFSELSIDRCHFFQPENLLHVYGRENLHAARFLGVGSYTGAFTSPSGEKPFSCVSASGWLFPR